MDLVLLSFSRFVARTKTCAIWLQALGWLDNNMSFEPLWDKFNLVNKKVSRRRHLKYASFSNRIKDCEEELGALLTSPIPQ